MRKDETATIKIERALRDRIATLQGDHFPSSSVNSLAEVALSQMITLLEAEPDERVLPELLAQVDAIRANRARRPGMHSVINSPGAAVAMHAAEIAVATSRKQRR